MAEGFEPSRGRINNPVPYQLGYATKNWLREQELNLPVLVYETSEPPLLYSRVKVLEAMKGVEPLSTGLQDRRSVIQLSYIAIISFKFQVSSFEFQVSSKRVWSRL